jgi:hypothetical protein
MNRLLLNMIQVYQDKNKFQHILVIMSLHHMEKQQNIKAIIAIIIHKTLHLTQPIIILLTTLFQLRIAITISHLM